MKGAQPLRPALPQTPPPADPPLRRWELAGIAGLALFWLWLRSISVYNHPWDNDEAQHLHVVWAWTQGLIPYRDFFDNHAPLFHLLCAPVLSLIGERADVISLMRWCMVPLILLIFWCTYRLGTQMFSKRVGVVAALLCAFHRDYFSKVGEFRTDVLWTVFWMATLVLLTGPRRSRGHWFLAGLAFGAAFATSQKSLILSLVLLFSTLLTCLLARTAQHRPAATTLSLLPSAGALTLSFWLAFILVPGLLLFFFYLEGAWSQLGYCLVGHNLFKAADGGSVAPWGDYRHLRLLRFWSVVPAAVAGWFILRRSVDRGRACGQVWVVMIGGSYCMVLLAVLSVISAQDYLPYYPVWMVTVSGGLFWLGRQATQRLTGHRWLQPLLLTAILGVELGWLIKHVPFSDRRNRFREEQLREVLALTRPNEPVFDAVGGSVYRPRAIPYVMELLTRRRMRAGLFADDVVQRLVATRTAVAINLSWFPKATQAFIDQNYLYVGFVHIAGKQVKPDAAGTVHFWLEVPNRYVLVDTCGLVPGSLDGGPPMDRFDLNAGEQAVKPDRAIAAPCYLLIERAYEAGFTPFNGKLKMLERWRGAMPP